MDFDSDSPSTQDISFSYLSACDISVTNTDIDSAMYISYDSDSHCSIQVPRTTLMYTSKSSHSLLVPTDSSISSRSLLAPADTPYTLDPQASIFAKRKYKPVARKVRPVIAALPDKFRITRNIVGDPLADMPQLSPNPPPFVPTGRYTAECRAIIDRVHPGDFLWPQERELMHHFMCVQNQGFAWNDSQ